MPNKPTTAGAKKPRGRPPHAPTAAQRRRVSVAAGDGMTREEIAIAIGIDRDTLAKHYEAELSKGALERRMEVYQGLHAAAKRGNSGAAKAYLAVEPQIAAPPMQPDAPAETPAAPAAQKAAPLGKKEQAQADALTAPAGTEWGALLPTPLQ